MRKRQKIKTAMIKKNSEGIPILDSINTGEPKISKNIGKVRNKMIKAKYFMLFILTLFLQKTKN